MASQIVEFHYREAPDFDPEAVAARASALIDSKVECGPTSEDVVHFVHHEFATEYPEGLVPPMTVLAPFEDHKALAEYEEILAQSWHCEDAEDRLAACGVSIGLVEMMASQVHPVDRLTLFHGLVEAMVEISEPHAVVFRHSQQVLDPAFYQDSCELPAGARPGAVNIRLFNIGDTDGEMLMDSRGLEEVGLHDLQCHFQALDPDDVGRHLFNCAMHILENGPVFESGHTVDSPDGSGWVCHFMDALVPPERQVLDFSPRD